MNNENPTRSVDEVWQDPTPAAEPSEYQMESGDDIASVFSSDFDTIAGDGRASADVRALGHQAGYRVRNNDASDGWTATRNT